ncbi:polyprenyl synthetase family protein [Nonomuraea phyllanthi]|uniref:polyprenyl synthetase family protein n=1 Tax=Nonomuraea phyllanthi TaxID=2219224 RepID=UPI0012930C34|nr:polyprenyl synthetase family protein [Nonomuraea phyllanthi]QFY10170.1 polyprenyl synthetase family protein [Nonomuraea phyllanthi]
MTPGLVLGSTLEKVQDRLVRLAASLPAPLRDPVRALVDRPSKLLRPRLLLACARLGAPPTDQVVRAAAMVELVHVASLIHDDVVDKAPTRRGGPSAHVLAGPEGAMLAGLAVLALAGTEAADLGGGVSRVTSQTVATVSYGELLDVERAFDTTLSIDDYVELVRSKTGALFGLAARLGAALAPAQPGQVRAVARFGAAAGIAFQILDDCLEMDPDQRPGKPLLTDHMLGLFGAPTLYALRADESGDLARLLMRPGFGPGDMDAVRAHVTGLGGTSAARTLADQWRGQAVAALEGLPAGPARDELTDFAAHLTAPTR